MASALAAAELDVIASQREGGLDDYLGALDGRIEDLDEWIERAADSLLTFATQNESGFRRNSMEEKGSASTSTARSLFALHEYRCFLREECRKIPPTLDKTLRRVFKKWVLQELGTPGGITRMSDDSENGPNRFTDSHVAIVLGFAESMAADLNLEKDYESVRSCVNRVRGTLARQLRTEVEDTGILGLKAKDQAAHHFVTLHAIRAIDVSGQEIKDPRRIRSRVSATVLEQLGYHAADVMARFDPGALVFSTALLGRFKAGDREQLTEHAVNVASKVQTDDGAWLSEQVVAANGTSRIYVSSYEVGLGLAYLALRELAYGNAGLARAILPCLEKVMELVRASYIPEEAQKDTGDKQQRGPLRGWANDRSRWPGLIESWATASVLSFMLRYRMVMHELRQQLVLARYGASIKKTKEEIGWPDLELAFPPYARPGAQKAADRRIRDKLLEYSDPSDSRALTKALQKEVLGPVIREPGNRPDKASLILYGPPGSRKTSLVKQSALALNWPVLTLSPPDFLGQHGLDGFEGSAARIFNDLMRLRKVIVLFDECEDFFKPRRRPGTNQQENNDDSLEAGGLPDEQPPEDEHKRGTTQKHQDEGVGSRTIGAFLTAGMLPRLQRLRDNRWVIFFLATNIYSLDELDEAVRRPGRFDYADELRHPGVAAQKRYIKEHRRKDKLGNRVDTLRAALDIRASQLAPKDNPEVPYAVIDYLIAGILDNGWRCSRDHVASRLRDRMDEVDRPPSLTKS